MSGSTEKGQGDRGQAINAGTINAQTLHITQQITHQTTNLLKVNSVASGAGVLLGAVLVQSIFAANWTLLVATVLVGVLGVSAVYRVKPLVANIDVTSIVVNVFLTACTATTATSTLYYTEIGPSPDAVAAAPASGDVGGEAPEPDPPNPPPTSAPIPPPPQLPPVPDPEVARLLQECRQVTTRIAVLERGLGSVSVENVSGGFPSPSGTTTRTAFTSLVESIRNSRDRGAQLEAASGTDASASDVEVSQ